MVKIRLAKRQNRNHVILFRSVFTSFFSDISHLHLKLDIPTYSRTLVSALNLGNYYGRCESLRLDFDR